MILCKVCQDEGEGDCKFVIDGTELYGIRSILRSSNYKMRELIDRASDKNNIMLSSPVTAFGLYELMRYYGNGKLVIKEDTVVTIYLTVQYFQDVELENILTKYILNHLTSNLIIATHVLKCYSYFSDLNIQAKLNHLLTFNGYKYFSDSYIGRDYDPMILGYVLQIPMLIIESEDYIVEQLIKYYIKNVQKSNDSNVITLFQQILSFVHGKQLSSIGVMNLSQFQLLGYINSSSGGISRVYFKPTGNEVLDETLSELCSSNPSAFHLSDIMKDKLIKIMDLEVLLSKLINEENKNDKIFLLALIIIVELDFPYRLNEKEQFLCASRLINLYNNINQHPDICVNMILECTTLICFYNNIFGLIKVNFIPEDLVGILSNYFLMKKNNVQIFLEMLYASNIPRIYIILFLVNVWNTLRMKLNMNSVEDKNFYDVILSRISQHLSQRMNGSIPSSSQQIYMQQQQQQPLFNPPPFNPPPFNQAPPPQMFQQQPQQQQFQQQQNQINQNPPQFQPPQFQPPPPPQDNQQQQQQQNMINSSFKPPFQ